MNDLSTHQNEQEQLRRFLLLISYSGMGVDRALDDHLIALRQCIKNQKPVEEIKAAIDTITDCLRQVEEKVELHDGKPEADPKYILIELLNYLIEKSENSTNKKKLQKILSKGSSLSSEQIIHNIHDVFHRLEEQPKTKKSWHLFSKKSDKNDNSANETSPLDLPQNVIDALNHFIEQLGTIDIYQKVTQALNKQLQSLHSFDQLPALIEQMASSLLEAASQEHVQFESFLKTLNKRLLNVASFLNQAAVGHEATLKDTFLLDEELTTAIGDLQKEIQNSSGLGALKNRLATSFDHIIESVNRFKDTQNHRIQASLAELKIVNEQLKITEEEADRIKQNLMEQRFKAYSDPLTKLGNRYAYNERLSQEYTRWRRYRSPLSLAVGDIDLFKKVNDTHGHAAGDKVLQQIAEVLQQGIRESDFIARYGGEEFVILMPETALADATKAINKLRQLIHKEPVTLPGKKKLPVSLSFGVAEFEGGDTASDVFEKADKALYRAKEKGRNQVCAERS